MTEIAPIPIHQLVSKIEASKIVFEGLEPEVGRVISLEVAGPDLLTSDLRELVVRIVLGLGSETDDEAAKEDKILNELMQLLNILGNHGTFIVRGGNPKDTGVFFKMAKKPELDASQTVGAYFDRVYRIVCVPDDVVEDVKNVYFNLEEVEPGQEVELRTGSLLRFGDISATVVLTENQVILTSFEVKTELIEQEVVLLEPVEVIGANTFATTLSTIAQLHNKGLESDHCCIETKVQNGTKTITLFSSQFETMVNSTRIFNSGKIKLHHNDIITLGVFKFRVELYESYSKLVPLGEISPDL